MKHYLAGEVAKMLRIHRNTLFNWIKSRKINPRRDKLSGYYYWTKAEVDALKKLKGRA